MTIDAADEQSAANAGYTWLTPAETHEAQARMVSQMSDLELVRECLATAPDGYSRVRAGVEAALDSLGVVTPDAKMLARIYRLEDEHPTAATWAEMAPWALLSIVGGALVAKMLWLLWWRLVRAVVREARGAWRG